MVDGSLRILIVDDLATMRILVRRMLKAVGYPNVEEAESGASAWSKLNAERFDLVLTDWNMPDGDGISLLKKMRESAEFADLPVVMVTAEKKREYVLAAARAGASGYIIKPFSESALESKLRQALARSNRGHPSSAVAPVPLAASVDQTAWPRRQ